MVPQRVVHVLEAVEVHEHHDAHLVLAPDARHRALDQALEHRAVGEPGEAVGERLLLLLRRLAAQSLRGAGDHADERAPEQEQPDHEHDVERVRLALDLRGDGAVRQGQLERAAHLSVLAPEPERDEHLEHATQRGARRGRIVTRVRHLRDRRAVERGLDLRRRRKARSPTSCACSCAAESVRPFACEWMAWPRKTPSRTTGIRLMRPNSISHRRFCLTLASTAARF